MVIMPGALDDISRPRPVGYHAGHHAVGDDRHGWRTGVGTVAVIVSGKGANAGDQRHARNAQREKIGKPEAREMVSHFLLLPLVLFRTRCGFLRGLVEYDRSVKHDPNSRWLVLPRIGQERHPIWARATKVRSLVSDLGRGGRVCF